MSYDASPVDRRVTRRDLVADPPLEGGREGGDVDHDRQTRDGAIRATCVLRGDAISADTRIRERRRGGGRTRRRGQEVGGDDSFAGITCFM